MNAYWGGLKIYEVLGYYDVPENAKEFLGDMMVVVRFGNEKGTPFAVRTDDIVIED